MGILERYETILSYPWFDKLICIASNAFAIVQIPLDKALGFDRMIEGRLLGSMPDFIDTIVVFGCGYMKAHIQIDQRLQMALSLWRERTDAVIIVSGSDRSAENYFETAYMSDFLAARGVPRYQIVRDGNAHSTEAAVLDCRNAIDKEPLLLVTSAYHVKRCLVLARRVGLDAYGLLGEDAPPIRRMRYRLRDQIALYVCDWRIRKARSKVHGE